MPWDKLSWSGSWKRALSAYMFFSQDWRERIKTENCDTGFGEIGKLLVAKWKELDDSEKKVSVSSVCTAGHRPSSSLCFLITLPRLRIGDGLWYRSPYIELAETSYIQSQSSTGWLSTIRLCGLRATRLSARIGPERPSSSCVYWGRYGHFSRSPGFLKWIKNCLYWPPSALVVYK
ncbi:hypothetical protein B0H21DRAFT_695010 [Amylocystis lapponica]|nr:hypothetical protein B0H21DRAFT_695010 [Amylocystis lapponica]